MTQEPFVIIPIWVMDRLKGNPTAFLLYTLILMHNNESKGYAWPSQVRLAELMGCTKITVLRNLKFLEETGVIVVIRSWSGHKRNVNQYHISPTKADRDEEAVSILNDAPLSIAGATLSGITSATGTRLSLTRSKEQELTSETDAPENLVKNTKSPSSSSSKSSSKTNTQIATEDEAFMEFWSIYPRKVGKAAAHKAWKRAFRGPQKDLILSGVKVHAAEVLASERDLHFVPHPATWLNQEKWEDSVGQETKNQRFRCPNCGHIGATKKCGQC